MQHTREQALELQSEAEKIYAAYRHRSSYQRVEQRDETIIVHTIAVEIVIDMAKAKLKWNQYDDACDYFNHVLDDLYAACAALPLPFLDY